MDRMSEVDPSEIPDPRFNSYLIGHEGAEKRFLEAWTSGRLAHAWLICGQRGIGKATLAYRMARFVMSQGPEPHSGADLFGAPAIPDTLQMSAETPVFRRIAALGHGDFRAIERGWSDTKQTKRKTVIGVDEVRSVGSFLKKTPAEGGWRVVLIDAADEMNSNAANAVLKVLEEPPRRALLFLVAHSPDRLLPTIRSRCRRLDLRPLVPGQVTALMNRYRPDLSAEDTAALAVLGDGSIGRALELADEGGVNLFRDLVNLLDGVPKLSITRMHALADKTLRGDVFRTLSGLLSWWLARIAAQGARGGLFDLGEIVPGEHALAEKLLASAAPAIWAETWQEVGRIAERTLAVHLDRKRSLILMLSAIEQTAARSRAA
jgi:DNA polymerase III subunit delta'